MNNWKDIPGYNGCYQINELGQVRSIRILKPGISNKGYPFLILTAEGKSKYEYVHRLVAKTFLPQKEGKNVVMHGDDNPANCSLKNLTIGTQSENIRQTFERGRAGVRIPPQRIRKTNLEGIVIAEYGSLRQAGDSCNVFSTSISYAAKKKSYYKGGYWERI